MNPQFNFSIKRPRFHELLETIDSIGGALFAPYSEEGIVSEYDPKFRIFAGYIYSKSAGWTDDTFTSPEFFRFDYPWIQLSAEWQCDDEEVIARLYLNKGNQSSADLESLQQTKEMYNTLKRWLKCRCRKKTFSGIWFYYID